MFLKLIVAEDIFVSLHETTTDKKKEQEQQQQQND